MRGARGLLISICGGPDLTLYEVDEAATRIREEVDPNANIILGATFDDALEGTMRVSVVATGLTPEALGEVSEQEEAPPVAARVERKIYAAPIAPRVKIPRPAAIAHPVMQSLDAEAPAEDPTYEEVAAVARTAPKQKPMGRIPSIDQFPRIAQAQVAAQQSRIESIAEHSQKKRKGLFERLADVGLGRRADHHAPEAAAPAPAPRRADPKMQPQAAAPVMQEAPALEPQSSYDDDQLAIPAFLRRQAAS